MYAPGKEIQQYLQGVAERFGATRFIKTSHKVTRCEWLADEKKWKIDVTRTDTGETFEDKADILITARGQLNEVNWPDLPGLELFQGKLLHSGDWDDG
jgi:cation diffusion facilitator CzcD-associated flavoprotein CzcO